MHVFCMYSYQIRNNLGMYSRRPVGTPRTFPFISVTNSLTSKTVKVKHIFGTSNAADVLTKSLPKPLFDKCNMRFVVDTSSIRSRGDVLDT